MDCRLCGGTGVDPGPLRHIRILHVHGPVACGLPIYYIDTARHTLVDKISEVTCLGCKENVKVRARQLSGYDTTYPEL